jgi:hypothetical protein
MRWTRRRAGAWASRGAAAVSHATLQYTLITGFGVSLVVLSILVLVGFVGYALRRRSQLR